MTGDDDIRKRFAALRNADANAAPAVDVLLARPRVRDARPFALAAVAAVAAAVFVAVGIQLRDPKEPPRTGMSILEWRSPTASLLKTPGSELIHTVPTMRSTILHSAHPSLPGK
ncbi:MAG: hypothetical protein JWM95_23 [Gemmatimonadetes bacterium]|nr:hypothetical protein [Gemmatimonadota bacterium]